MKKSILISLLVIAMGVMAFVGCEKEKIENPTTTITASQTTENPSANPQGEPASVTHNTNLSYSDCHQNQRDGLYDPIISYTYENGILSLTINNFCLTCGTYTIVENSEIDDQTINVNFGIIYELQANCICSIDVDYSVDNIKPGSHELIIRRMGRIIYQEEITCE
ncbi:MAG: hypothetical protein IKP45_13635 [Bacteroidales bacterium]|nr:hypothetical protein [Bacteroidales bacterium]